MFRSATSLFIRSIEFNWRGIFGFDLVCRLVALIGLAPLGTWFVGAILRWSGEKAVSNFDLVNFFLSPQGILLVAAWSTIALASQLLQLGGLTLLVLGSHEGIGIPSTSVFRFLLARSGDLFALAWRLFLRLGGLFAVVVVVVLVVRNIFLSGGDLYYYLQVRPAEFLWAATIIGSVSSVVAAWALWQLLRWFVAIPIVLVQERPPDDALRASREWIRAVGLTRIIGRIGLWAGWLILLGMCAWSVSAGLERLAFAVAGTRVSWILGAASLVLGINFVIVLAAGVLGNTGLAVLVAEFYQSLSEGSGFVPKEAQRQRLGPPAWMILSGLTLLVAVLTVGSGTAIATQLKLGTPVKVTAHRGSSRVAPENTRAAILKAIEHEADYAEIDVQETADGVLVLLHDTDLRRVAGDRRSIWEIPYAELREMDVGRWFSEEFAGEKITTLEEAIKTAQGRIKLNIELKINGRQQRIEAETVRLIREANFSQECIVTSLDLGAMKITQIEAPELRRGLIVAARVGEPTRLDVNILAISASMVTRNLVARAHAAGQEVHVWTVNDPEQMLAMIHMGVDNILTSTPDVLRELLREREKMSDFEKTMLLVSDFLEGRL